MAKFRPIWSPWCHVGLSVVVPQNCTTNAANLFFIFFFHPGNQNPHCTLPLSSLPVSNDGYDWVSMSLHVFSSPLTFWNVKLVCSFLGKTLQLGPKFVASVPHGPGVNLTKLFWSKFTYFLYARSFQSTELKKYFGSKVV